MLSDLVRWVILNSNYSSRKEDEPISVITQIISESNYNNKYSHELFNRIPIINTLLYASYRLKHTNKRERESRHKHIYIRSIYIYIVYTYIYMYICVCIYIYIRTHMCTSLFLGATAQSGPGPPHC